jgi:peptidoglycan hydrolase-like protein with peptidoglycan-binding domain
VVKTPATFEKQEVPAQVETVKVRKLVAKAAEKRSQIPAEYKTVSKRNKVSDERLEWRQVLCETNMTKDVIVRLQQALQQAGYRPGPADGVMGGATLRAVDAFQQDKDLPRGGLTILTLESLGVNNREKKAY